MAAAVGWPVLPSCRPEGPPWRCVRQRRSRLPSCATHARHRTRTPFVSVRAMRQLCGVHSTRPHCTARTRRHTPGALEASRGISAAREGCLGAWDAGGAAVRLGGRCRLCAMHHTAGATCRTAKRAGCAPAGSRAGCCFGGGGWAVEWRAPLFVLARSPALLVIRKGRQTHRCPARCALRCLAAHRRATAGDQHRGRGQEIRGQGEHAHLRPRSRVAHRRASRT